MPHNYKYLNLVGLLNSLNWLRNVIVISFRIYTVLRAIKQTQASVHKVRRSIEDKLLSSQETTRKRAEHEDLLLKREQLCAEVTWRTASVNKMKDQADQLHRSNQEQGRVLWQNFASVICTKCSSVEIWFVFHKFTIQSTQFNRKGADWIFVISFCYFVVLRFDWLINLVEVSIHPTWVGGK